MHGFPFLPPPGILVPPPPSGTSPETVQFSSVQFLDRLGRRGDMRDDSAEILFQFFLQEALASSSGMGRDVHSLMLFIQLLLYERPITEITIVTLCTAVRSDIVTTSTAIANNTKISAVKTSSSY